MPKLETIVKNITKIDTKRKVHLTLTNSAFVKLQATAHSNKVSMSRIVEYLIIHEIKQ